MIARSATAAVTLLGALACGRTMPGGWLLTDDDAPAGVAGSGAAGSGGRATQGGAGPRVSLPRSGAPGGGQGGSSGGETACADGCDDGNACTRDECSPDVGCVHQDVSSQCAVELGPDACLHGQCDAVLGCLAVPLPDGQACGAADCVSERVCAAGACVERSVAEGTPCGRATPCQSRGACRDLVCEDAPIIEMKPAWSYRGEARDSSYIYSIALAPSGDLYAGSYDGVSKLISLTSDGAVRFEVETSLWLSAIDPPSGLVLLSGYQRWAEARSMQDGRLVWSVDLSEGLPVEHPDEAGNARFGSKGGTLLGDSGLVAFNVEEGAWLHTSHVVALSLQTGEKQWSVRHPGHLYGMVSDADGNLYVSRGGCWAPFDITASISSDGRERWTRSEQGIPIAHYGSSLLMNHVLSAHVLDSETSSARCDATNVTSAVVSKGTVFGVSEQFSLVGFGANDCSPKWNVLPARGQLVSPLLTTTDSVLIVDEHAGETDLAAELKEIDASGNEKFSCRLPRKLTSDTVLDRGRWIAGFGHEIHAFDAPELELAAAGWVSHRGNLTRSGLPRGGAEKMTTR